MQNDMSQEEFEGFLQDMLGEISKDDLPQTHGWVDLLLKESQGLSESGREITVKRLIALLIPVIANLENKTS